MRYQSLLSRVEITAQLRRPGIGRDASCASKSITFWNFTIINCGLSCSNFWSVVFRCSGFGKLIQILHPNCCLVFLKVCCQLSLVYMPVLFWVTFVIIITGMSNGMELYKQQMSPRITQACKENSQQTFEIPNNNLDVRFE